MNPTASKSGRRHFAVAAGTAAGLLLAACGSSEPELVTYAASSSVGADIEVTYQTDDGEVVEIVESPWELELERSGSFSANLEVRNVGLDGDVACQVRSTAFPSVAIGGEAAALCFARVTRQGGTTEVSTSSDFELFLRNADGDRVGSPAGLIEPQRAEIESITDLGDGRVLLGGHQGVYLLDTSSGVVDEIEGSREFGNPVDVARGDDGAVYATHASADRIELLSSDGTVVSDVAEFPDGSPGGVWLIDGHLLVLLRESQALVSLTEDGSERWRYEFTESVPDAHVVALGDGRMIVGSREQPLVGLDVESGEQSFEWPVTDELGGIIRREGLLFLSFYSDDGDGTVAVPIGGLDDITASESWTIEGSGIVFDRAGTPYIQDGDTVSRLDPSSFAVDRSIELPDLRLVAAGDGVLFLAGDRSSSSSVVKISSVPTTLFD